MNRQDTIAAINDIGQPHKVTFTLSNLEVGSHYALIDKTGEVVEMGVAEFPEVNLYVDEGTYDVRVRSQGLLPFSCEDVYVENKGLTFHINQVEDHIFTEPEQEEMKVHELFDAAMYLLFAEE